MSTESHSESESNASYCRMRSHVTLDQVLALVSLSEVSAGLTAVERSFRVGDCETSDEESRSLPVALAESVPGP
jgi:hypothetical protein